MKPYSPPPYPIAPVSDWNRGYIAVWNANIQNGPLFIPTPFTIKQKPVEDMISIGNHNSSFSTPYITFVCSVCKTEHISYERGKHELFIIPSTITTSQNKNKEWQFHCIGECNVS